MNNFDLSHYTADQLEIISSQLYERVAENIEIQLKEQCDLLGVDTEDKEFIKNNFESVHYPQDELKICSYLYKSIPILEVRRSENGMAIEFLKADIDKVKEELKKQGWSCDFKPEGEV